MATVEPWLRFILNHPKHRTIVIILSCVVAVLTVWPAVDKYSASSQHVDEARKSLEQARQTIEQAATQRAEFAEQLAQLQQLETQAFGEADVQKLRTWLVETARETGCQIRRIDLGQSLQRKWYGADDPFETKKPEKAEETPFQLRSQNLSVTVIGDVSQIRQLLGKLGEAERLAHTSRLQMRLDRTGPNEALDRRKDVALDLDIVLFGLEKAKHEEKKSVRG